MKRVTLTPLGWKRANVCGAYQQMRAIKGGLKFGEGNLIGVGYTKPSASKTHVVIAHPVFAMLVSPPARQ